MNARIESLEPELATERAGQSLGEIAVRDRKLDLAAVLQELAALTQAASANTQP